MCVCRWSGIVLRKLRNDCITVTDWPIRLIVHSVESSHACNRPSFRVSVGPQYSSPVVKEQFNSEYAQTYIQENFDGSNTFGTMEICSR